MAPHGIIFESKQGFIRAAGLHPVQSEEKGPLTEIRMLTNLIDNTFYHSPAFEPLDISLALGNALKPPKWH
jgi:hypothetical protein